MNLEQYRASANETHRTTDLLRIVPKNRHSVLDIGARDGYFSVLLKQYFTEVVAMDLQKPSFTHPGVVTIQGDVTSLQFPDNSFDCVFCTEVLEHIRDLELACREIARVARCEIVIGVPFKQDIRFCRTTCQTCGKTNPPWGHINSFDEEQLARLFNGLAVSSKSFVGTNNARTNRFSAVLMDLAGNPWGTYDQEEPCLHCGSKLISPPAQRTLWSRACSSLAARSNEIQRLCSRPHANWIHLVFSKT